MEFRIGWHHGRKGSFDFQKPIYLHPSVYIDNTGDIKIGKGVSIARNTEIYTHEHYHDGLIEEDVLRNRAIIRIKIIGDNVYIGAGVIILASCTEIGDNAVIGAGAVVTKSIPPGETWAGNPAAKIIKRRL